MDLSCEHFLAIVRNLHLCRSIDDLSKYEQELCQRFMGDGWTRIFKPAIEQPRNVGQFRLKLIRVSHHEDHSS